VSPPIRAWVYALVADDLLSLPRMLRAAFVHPWVASYQVGFGPPLVGATPALRERVRGANGALEKLDVYLEHCILDHRERTRLAEQQRRLLVRRMGPLEAEELSRASMDALDLSLRLHVPSTAPAAARRSMEERGVDLESVPVATPPEHLTGRFVVSLSDPMNDRLLHVPEVVAAAPGPRGTAMALELRASVHFRPLWNAYLEVLSYVAPFRAVEVGDPAAHARVTRDGAQR